MYKYHCKYCNEDFLFQQKQQIGAHVTNCKMNPNYEKRIQKLRHKKKEYQFICPNCGKKFSLLLSENNFKKGKHRKYCSRKCANVRHHSQETKDKISMSLKNNGFFKEYENFKMQNCIEKPNKVDELMLDLKYKNTLTEIKFKKYPKIQYSHCQYCGKYFVFIKMSKSSKGKFCSNSCKSKHYSKKPFYKFDDYKSQNILLQKGMKSYVYKTTNLKNGKYYIGVHVSDDIENDTYLGSGILLKKSIKKYGKQNFSRQILKQFQDYNNAFKYQNEIVNKQLLSDEMCYNICVGGHGGPHFKNKHHSQETKRKLSLMGRK